MKGYLCGSGQNNMGARIYTTAAGLRNQQQLTSLYPVPVVDLQSAGMGRVL
jgi:hypothetical protein